MTAKKFVLEDSPTAFAEKDVNAEKGKRWAININNKKIAFGTTENSAWMNAKKHIMNKVMRKIYSII